MPRLTIIIPYLKSDTSELLEETLASILENRSDSTDICVVNAGQYYDSYNIEAEGVRFLHLEPTDSLLDCINLGIQESQSDFVHPILCGATVKNDWTTKPLQRLENPEISAVIPLIIETDFDLKSFSDSEKMSVLKEKTSHKIVHAGYIYRRNGSVIPLKRNTKIQRWDRIAPHIGGAFFRRSTLEELGGLNLSYTAQLSYIDLSLLFAHLNERTVWEVNSIIYYPIETFRSEKEQNRLEWITDQEKLYSRWTDLGERFGTVWQHQFRVFGEAFRELFSGNMFEILKAFQKGKIANALEEKQLLIKKVQKSRQLQQKALASRINYAEQNENRNNVYPECKIFSRME